MKKIFTACVAVIGLFFCILVLTPQAEAGLVEDLRSGKNDVRASVSSGGWTGIIRVWRQQKSAQDYKAIVTARSHSYWRDGGRSAESAIKDAINYCKELGIGRTRCEV